MNNRALKFVLAEHKRWLETGGKEGRRADLRGAELAGASLHAANLDGANLTGADLRRANLRGANLRCASLCWGEAGGRISLAKLAGAKLPADCDWVFFGPVDFTEVDLRGVDLSNAHML